ncbi:MAG TPA: molybdopterin oxidoreductase family protein [Blastocatellia bacterium]|nr:molybdopterin oxidoreductase family protein [Blastocatellia bacterium]
MSVNYVDRQIVRAACPHDCPDTCAMLVTVENGRVTRVTGDPKNPFTHGALCSKVNRYEQRVYHPDRLLYPMRRIGPKCSGRFERITWDRAITEITDKFKEISNSSDGPEAILPYSYGGSIGPIQANSMGHRFFYRLGASKLDRTICSSAGTAGLKYTLGGGFGTDPERFADAKLILIWGSNVITSNLHLWPFILKAKKNGAKVITIDPYRTRTAAASDQHIAILPGTDAALALGMMNIIIAEGMTDLDYINKYTIGFDQLAERAAEFPPDRTAHLTGLTEKEVVDLARAYGTTRPAAIRINYGLQRHAGGGMAVRTIACLPAVVGAWQDAAGGVLLSTGGNYNFNYDAIQRPDLIKGNPRTINMSALGDALLDAQPPVKAIYVYCSNPAAVAPEQAKVIKGLLREDLFVVVHEQFMTDTTDYADIVLPATTQLEQFELMRSYGHLYVVLNQSAIPPVGEAKCNNDVFREMAKAMGFEEQALKDTDEQIGEQLLLNSDNPNLNGITLDRLKREGWIRLNVPEIYAPFAEGNFRTPSGKCEFYSEQMAKEGLDPVPNYTPPRESRLSNPGLASKYPLELISPPAEGFLNTTFGNMSDTLRKEKRPAVTINPRDAASRQINDGDIVRVFNDRGSCQLAARVSPDARPGVAVAYSIWWNKLSPDHSNVNQTTGQGLTDMGGGATFYDNLVEITRLDD